MPAFIENNMIAWKGETPWHGLGWDLNLDQFEQVRKQLTEKFGRPATDTEVWLHTSGLDWPVQRRAIAMRPGDGDQTKLLVAPLKGFKAIVRADTDYVFQVATDMYHPVQNKEIVEFFREYCEAGHATMETVGGLKNGAIVWALASLNGGTNVKIGGVDEVKGYMLLATAHDGSLQTIGRPTEVRVVCWNTLSAALGLGAGKLGAKDKQEFRMRHTRKWSPAVAAEAKEVMGMAVESIQATNEMAEKLAKVKIDAEGRLQFVEQLLKANGSLVDAVVEAQQPAGSASLLDNIIAQHQQDGPQSRTDRLGRVGKAVLEAIVSSPGSELPTAKDTLWGAVNGVSWYTDHERGRSQDTGLASAWFGAGKNLKNEAVQVATQMAGIA